MAVEKEHFLKRCLLLDIEINEKNIIYSIGAVLGDKTFSTGSARKVDAKTLEELDHFGREADFVLGHNIISHDIPRIREVAPGLKILDKPLIDTLYLSPLAYPENPYHRLVKDYQLVRDSVNDPVQDAELAGKIFCEQWDAISTLLTENSELPLYYRSFFHGNKDLAGTAEALAAMGGKLLEDDDLHEAFAWFASKHGCSTAAYDIVDQLHVNEFDTAMLAYVAAWLSVAGGNSVLPPWVRNRFPQISTILYRLREKNCNSSRCSYCNSHHDPHVFLKRFFGFDDFRAQPATEDGKSLQQEVVSAGENNTTLFATLPTGGGKSLCYLLPGLMRYQRRNLLTIVISPLQALMKDQVDNFSKQTGTKIATALYGMLTMPERGEVLESIRLGDTGILYVSPEQLRNRSFVQTISQREIGAWVFDEAHCLSKWGHDFRPDYFYAIRFIREFAAKSRAQIPPVQCFTATAKRDVKYEIVDTIQSELGLRVNTFEGGHERTNLKYDVYAVDKYEKYQVILDLLKARYMGDGSVVIYCATKKNTENLAEFLQNSGYTAEAFHAGLENSIKKRVQDQFIEGLIPVICATNAFGMGIDKDDVRLVIHADIPGSLENYLQEAGRAGRDRKEAECILVFDEQDIEGQFRLGSMSRLTRREIAQMLRGIRSASRGGDDVVLTAGELLRRDDVDIDPEKLNDVDTRVRTAIAWLERAGFLERNENNTMVFEGKPLVRDFEEAARKISGLNLSERQTERWLAILSKLMENCRQSGFSADELASLSSFATAEGDGPYETENQRVIRTLHDMAEQGLISKETNLSAFLRYKVGNNATVHLKRLSSLEREFLAVIEELAPDAEVETPLELDLQQVNQQLVDLGYEYSTPHVLKLILHGLSRDGKGLAGRSGSLSLRAIGANCFTIYLHRGWENLLETVKIRQQAACIALQVILGTVSPAEKPNGSLLVEFSLEQIVEGLKKDLLLLPKLKKPLAAAERALTFMHEQGVIDLQQGLAIFNQAMTLRLYPEERKRRYTAADFSPLKTHYTERNFQVHVMNEYAHQALEKISTAMRMVSSYFNDEKDDFVNRYFPGRKKMLERATSEQSYQRIVDDLKNKAQSTIVSAHAEKNMLVLAGPGAGKTRVVTHRVAFLLRVERVSPDNILVLCFNRSAVMSLRRRLRELVGHEMSRVTTLTFHGLALRLTGRSLVTARANRDNEIDFTRVIQDAIDLLKGESDVLGLSGDSARSELVGRFSHILVDEYQDIDDEQYELVSLLAGKTQQEYDQKMTILAVGDDDQNIYRFRGANVSFIRKFHEDYEADKLYLVENYRSTANIIAACNSLIQHNCDRMKTEQPIRVNEARRMLPMGGNWQINDPLARGKVQVLKVGSVIEEGYAILQEIGRLQALEGHFDLDNCAVLGREWKDLDALRSIFEANNMPVNLHWGRGGSFPRLTRIREHRVLLDYLKENRTESITGSQVMGFIVTRLSGDNLWLENLRQLTREWIEETHDAEQPVSLIEDYFYEALSDQGRSKNLGNGVFLSTVHSVKGLEFDHVFMLGESWHSVAGEEMEDERRLYYVGMSRARETLQLLSVNTIANPHCQLLGGEYCITREISPKGELKHTRKEYTLLGMEDVFLDFAGVRAENHPARKALAKLQAGDTVLLEIRNDHLELVNSEGVSVARLSKAARNIWVKRLNDICDIRVVAIVQRYRDEIADKSFREKCRGESWEVPVVEITSHNRRQDKNRGQACIVALL
jgi:ATP-dependent DNA helicase RecQ